MGKPEHYPGGDMEEIEIEGSKSWTLSAKTYLKNVCDKIESKCHSVGPQTKWSAVYVRQEMENMLIKHKKFIHEFGVDMDEITSWKWNL